MTPILCATEVANFLKETFAGYKTTDTDSEVNVFTGFLPKAYTASEKLKKNPYIVVRPTQVTDGNLTDESICELQILVTVYDSDPEKSCLEMYHILEVARQALLTEEIINQQYVHSGETKTMVPEEQPYPLWWSYITISYIVKRPEKNLLPQYFDFR